LIDLKNGIKKKPRKTSVSLAGLNEERFMQHFVKSEKSVGKNSAES